MFGPGVSFVSLAVMAMVALVAIVAIVVVVALASAQKRASGIGAADVRWSVKDESASEGAMIAFGMNNRETGVLALTPKVVDLDGQAIMGEDGNPIVVESISVEWTTENSESVGIGETSNNGQTVELTSGKNGTSNVVGTMLYPKGATKKVEFLIAVGNSEPGDPEVTFETKPEA